MDLESRGMVLSCSKNKGDDQLCNYCEADLHLCFRIVQNVDFLMPRCIHCELHMTLSVEWDVKL